MKKTLCRIVISIFVLAGADYTAAAISPETFRSPPHEAKPHTWWHWMNGNVTKAGITADLEAMSAVGIGGAQIFDAGLALPKGPVAFASEEWYDCLAHANREAKRLGLELCMANCSGWTSSAGPWVTPALAMKFVTNTVVRVKGGTRFDGNLPLPERTNGFYEDIAILAFPTPKARANWRDFDWQVFRRRGAEHAPVMPETLTESDMPCAACVAKNDIVDLTMMVRAGHLAWAAPATHPEWTVLRIGYMCNGRQNRSASAAGLGLECDKLDSHALDVHFDAYIGEALKRFGKGGAFNNVLLDSYEVHGQNWTHGFEKTFAERMGYEIICYLPVLAGYPVENAAETERFLKDFRLTLSEQFVENYAHRLQRRCHENGLLFSCEPYGNGPFDDLEYARFCDIPMSEFWQPLTNGTDLAAMARDPHRTYMEARWGNRALGNGKIVAATAHVWGKRIVGAEACTAYPTRDSGRWLQGPYELKAQIDRVLADGVNRMVFHRFVHQPWTDPTFYPGMTMAAYGGHFDRTQTWWQHGAKEFFTYLARAQHLLQSGTFVADVLLCTSGEAPDYGTGGEIPEGYDGDRCHPNALAECRVENGRVVVPGGISYCVVGTPPRHMLRPEVTAALRHLEQAGATVVDYGEVWEALKRRGCARDFMCSDRDVRWLHRQIDGDEVYFVAVPNNAPKKISCSFRVTGKVPELWNAVDGTVSKTRFAERGGRTEIILDCPPAHSIFVVFRMQPTVDAEEVCGGREKLSLPVTGTWHVAFQEPGRIGCVAVADFASLASWTSSASTDIRYFSGTATYTKTVKCPETKGQVVLDLGQVKNIAEVSINGKSYPAIWKPPFAVDITDAVVPGGNIAIQVKVTNYWPNRLIGDARHEEDCEWDDGKNSRGYSLVKAFPEWLKGQKHKSPTGRHSFTTCRLWTAGEPLLESGLIGPVLIKIVGD